MQTVDLSLRLPHVCPPLLTNPPTLLTFSPEASPPRFPPAVVHHPERPGAPEAGGVSPQQGGREGQLQEGSGPCHCLAPISGKGPVGCRSANTIYSVPLQQSLAAMLLGQGTSLQTAHRLSCQGTAAHLFTIRRPTVTYCLICGQARLVASVASSTRPSLPLTTVCPLLAPPPAEAPRP